MPRGGIHSSHMSDIAPKLTSVCSAASKRLARACFSSAFFFLETYSGTCEPGKAQTNPRVCFHISSFQQQGTLKMHFLKKILIAAVTVSALTNIALAAKDLSGKYAMDGTSLRPNSRPYAGACELKRADRVYDVDCVNSDSGDKYTGKGIQRGDLFSLHLGEYLVVYRVSPTDKLDGEWAHTRSDDYGRESLTPR
jgi:hypothetical protein